VVSWPDHRGLLAVLHAGDVAAPRREDALLHAVLRGAYAPQLFRAPEPYRGTTAAAPRGQTEGAWLRVPDDVPGRSPAVGPCWDDPDDAAWTGGGAGSGAGTVAALIGAAGPVPAVDLRVGQALETVRLTATALGLAVRVLAAPAAPAALGIRSSERTGADVLAVVRLCWPTQ
jgi:hypothetical protein